MPTIEPEELAHRATDAAQSWASGCELSEVTTLEGGSVSLVYTARVSGGPADHETIVLKVAPPGLMPKRNRDVLRQARGMEAVGRARGVAVPEILFTDEGDPPDVPPFFASAFVPGENAEPLLVAGTEKMDEDIVRGRAFAATRMLASLQSANPTDLGLDEPETSLQGEIDRWTAALDTVPDEVRVGYRECAAALSATVPDALPSVVLHGDYRLGNMLCVGTEIRSIIDWEIWSVADPRIDLSWFLFFTDEAQHPSARHGVFSGMPTQAELIEMYEREMDTTVTDLVWFDALTRYKEAAAISLIAKNAAKRGDGDQRMAGLGPMCVELIADAHSRIP